MLQVRWDIRSGLGFEWLQDYLMTLVSGRSSVECAVEVTVENWFPFAKSEPSVKLADSDTDFSMRKDYMMTLVRARPPSDGTKCLCSLVQMWGLLTGSSRDGSQSGAGCQEQTSSLCQFLGRKTAMVDDGQQRWSRKLHVRSTGPRFCQTRQDPDRRFAQSGRLLWQR